METPSFPNKLQAMMHVWLINNRMIAPGDDAQKAGEHPGILRRTHAILSLWEIIMDTRNV